MQFKPIFEIFFHISHRRWHYFTDFYSWKQQERFTDHEMLVCILSSYYGNFDEMACQRLWHWIWICTGSKVANYVEIGTHNQIFVLVLWSNYSCKILWFCQLQLYLLMSSLGYETFKSRIKKIIMWFLWKSLITINR